MFLFKKKKVSLKCSSLYNFLFLNENFVFMETDLCLCRFSVATAEELAANDDDCAICWDSMLTARKLPCGHLFHK